MLTYASESTYVSGHDILNILFCAWKNVVPRVNTWCHTHANIWFDCHYHDGDTGWCKNSFWVEWHTAVIWLDALDTNGSPVFWAPQSSADYANYIELCVMRQVAMRLVFRPLGWSGSGGWFSKAAVKTVKTWPATFIQVLLWPRAH